MSNTQADWTTEQVACKKCGTSTDALAMFPGGICLKCHAEKLDKLPLERPNFVGTLNLRTKRGF